MPGALCSPEGGACFYEQDTPLRCNLRNQHRPTRGVLISDIHVPRSAQGPEGNWGAQLSLQGISNARIPPLSPS